MAVPAIDPQTGDVVLMTEGNGLVSDNADSRDVIGTNEHGHGRPQTGHKKNGAEDAYLRQSVETSVKDLSHGPLLVPTA